MDAYTVAHRWANKDFGKRGTLTASSCRCEGRNYFSYSTVFGQWVDMKKNVVVIFEGSTSNTSSKHKLGAGYFPAGTHVFPYNNDGSCSYWSGCNLISSYEFEDEDFQTRHRIKLLDYYVRKMYNRFENITKTKSKGAENVDFDAWHYFEELCSLYKDVSVKKYIATNLKFEKSKKDMNAFQKDYIKKTNLAIGQKKVMINLLAAGERNVQVITDAMFGEGSYQNYMDYCQRFIKADKKKGMMLSLCERLGIANPYREYWGDGWQVRMSVAEVRKLTAKERNEIHFRALMDKEHYDNSQARNEKYDKNHWNAYRWVIGFQPQTEKRWRGEEPTDRIANCKNMFTGEVYSIEQEHIYGYYWLNTDVDFNYNSFRTSENKEQWIREFYDKCKEAQENRKALRLLKKNGVVAEKEHSYDEDRFTSLKEVFSEPMTEDEIRLCRDFIDRQNAHYALKDAEKRAARIRREQEEAARKAEEEYRNQVKKEQIESCLKNGIEGCRDLWRKHLTSIDEAKERYREVAFENKGDFYHNGNVLMRFSLDKQRIETSKHITIDVATCKKMWKAVSLWHEHPEKFKECTIQTHFSGNYRIVSYKNDILTAGCHDIAYEEMKHMYEEIIANENAA